MANPKIKDEHITTLFALAAWAKDAPTGIVARATMAEEDFAVYLRENADEGTNWRGGLGRVLNELTTWGYLDRLKAPSLARDKRPGYRLTPAGETVVGKSAA